MKTFTDNSTTDKESDLDDGTDTNSDGDGDSTGIIRNDGGEGEDNSSENQNFGNDQWMDAFYHPAVSNALDIFQRFLMYYTQATQTELPQAMGVVQPFESHIPNSLPSNEFDFSGLQTGDIAMYTTPLLRPFDMDDLNSFFDSDMTNFFDTSFDLSTSSLLPTPGPVVSRDYAYDTDQCSNTCDNPMLMKPLFPDNPIIPSASITHSGLGLLPAIPHANNLESSSALTPAVQSGSAATNNCNPATATLACGVLGTSNPDSHTHQSDGPQGNASGPRRTTRRHIPSMREHVDNAIGSSSVRTNMPLADGKENDKRKANPVGTLHRSSK